MHKIIYNSSLTLGGRTRSEPNDAHMSEVPDKKLIDTRLKEQVAHT